MHCTEQESKPLKIALLCAHVCIYMHTCLYVCMLHTDIRTHSNMHISIHMYACLFLPVDYAHFHN